MDDASRLILVEDDAEIATLVAAMLAQHGFAVATVTDGRELDAAMRGATPDLVLLDIMLPGPEDGLAICRRLRATPATARLPVIMLTAVGTDTDRIVGLEIGADDYVTKPFNPRELLARIRAVLRRGAPPAAAAQPTLAFGDWRVDLATHTLTGAGDVRVPLTTGEFAMLVIFCRNARAVLSRDALMEALHGRAAAPADRSIDIQVSRLRRKIEPDPADPTLIRTVRGGGYMFTPRVTTLTGDP